MRSIVIPDVTGAFDNIVALENQITTDVAGLLGLNFNVAAYPFMRYRSEVYPKWLNGLGDDRPQPFGIHENADPVKVNIELQLGKVTEGYDGNLEKQLYTWVPYTVEMFRVSPKLKSAERPTAPLGLLEAEIQIASWLAPGEIIAARFVLLMNFYVTNYERDF